MDVLTKINRNLNLRETRGNSTFLRLKRNSHLLGNKSVSVLNTDGTNADDWKLGTKRRENAMNNTH